MCLLVMFDGAWAGKREEVKSKQMGDAGNDVVLL